MRRAFAAIVCATAAFLAVGAAAAQTVTFTPDPIVLVPNHREGDFDFAGHGPEVTVTTNIHLIEDREVHFSIQMKAREKGGDRTTAEEARSYVLYTAPLGKKILRIAKPTANGRQSYTYTDKNYKNDVHTLGAGGTCSKYEITGDTKGDESGSKTKVKVYFNPVTVELADRELAPGEGYVTFSGKKIQLQTGLAGEDADFGNQDTKIVLAAKIWVEKKKRVLCEINFYAQETKKKKNKWTKVVGLWTGTLYEAPKGKKVLSVDGVHTYLFWRLEPRKPLNLKKHIKHTYEDPRDNGPVDLSHITIYTKGKNKAQDTQVEVWLGKLNIRTADSKTLKPGSSTPTGTATAPVTQ